MNFEIITQDLNKSSRIRFFLVLALVTVGTHILNSQRLQRSEESKGTRNVGQQYEKRVDSLFANLTTDTPGAALSVTIKGDIIFSKGYGSANLEYGIPIDVNSIFHVASISKQVTAYLILLLNQQGKLALEDDIRDYLPEVPDFGATITIKHLMDHTSGLRDQWILLSIAGWRLDDVITQNQIMRMIGRQKELNFSPGDDFMYCNTGYTLLAEIIERVSGKSFSDFARDKVFEPLQMHNTFFYSDHETIVKNRVYSYYHDSNSEFKKSNLNYASVGATSMFSNVEDIGVWASYLNTISKEDSFMNQQFTKSGKLNSGKATNYSSGQFIGTYQKYRSFWHGGADAGYRAHVLRIPKLDFSVVVLGNFEEFDPRSMAKSIADIFLEDIINPNKKADESTHRYSLEDNGEETKDLIGRYLFDSGDTIKVVADQNDLLVKHLDKELHLKKIAIDVYGDSTNGTEIVFKRDFFYRVIGLEYKNKVQKRIASKVLLKDGVKLNRPEYEGNYYSEELGTMYQIRWIGHKFMVFHQRHEPFELRPMDSNNFIGNEWFFDSVEFIRDDKEDITGFEVTFGGVRALQFLKLNGEGQIIQIEN
ncbi:serine hydrolase domain-containing protein [Flagellimonas nanhaiensis]|nr:serine hydrolase domain-containing protein [Allomuricauda nanhaiensis]